MITEDQLAAMFQALPSPEPVVLKLYYDKLGNPIVYSCDTLEGNYIEVDPETFAIASMHVKVENGILKHLPPVVYVNKLTPDNYGTLCHSQDVAVVTKDTGTYWKLKTYESN